MMLAAAGVPILLGVALLGVGRARANKNKKRNLQLVRDDRGTGATGEVTTYEARTEEAEGTGPVTVIEPSQTPVDQTEGLDHSRVHATQQLEDASERDEIAQNSYRVVVRAPRAAEPTDDLATGPVLATPVNSGRLMPARSVVRVVRRVDRAGNDVDTPVVLDGDGMLEVPVIEDVPDPDEWQARDQERVVAFEAARTRLAEEEAQKKQEEERRQVEAQAMALVELERQKNVKVGWWITLDENASTDAERSAIASSLGTVSMPWAEKVLRRAMIEDESLRVRARAVGAYVRAGFLEDPAPFHELLAANDRLISLAVREALAPHQDLVWVRSLFA